MNPSLSRSLAALMIGLASVVPSRAERQIAPAEAQRDLRILEEAFNKLHPGLARYAGPAAVAQAFAQARQSVAEGATTRSMFLQVTRLAALLRCGHTWTNPSNQGAPVRASVLDAADKLPLTLRFVAGRMLVTGSALAGVQAGTELLAINGRNGEQIRQALLPYLRADGNGAGADGKRLAQLDHSPTGGAMDWLFPLLFAPQERGWTLVLKERGAAARELTVPATTTAARDRSIGAKAAPKEWTLAFDGDTALLTLPTFAFWNSSFDARAFAAQAFAAIAERGTRFLVIDQRANEGGSTDLGHLLVSALISAPQTLPVTRRESAYERAPYALARYLDTWNFDFFDRTGQVRKSASGRWLLAEEPPLTIKPAALPGMPFAGRVVLLVGAQNSSAGFLFARDVKASGAAVLVGQPTGGNLRGLNGGELAWITLPASKVAVDIPLIASFTAGEPPDAGVEPDLPVAPSFDDAAAGIDTEMRAAQALIARWRGAGGTKKNLPDSRQGG